MLLKKEHFKNCNYNRKSSFNTFLINTIKGYAYILMS